MMSGSYLRWIFIVLFGLFTIAAFNNCGGIKAPESTDLTSAQSIEKCALAPSELRKPATIDDVVRLINALPKPVSIPCLIANLPKPLKVYAVDSSISAQPSAGPDSPRVFIMNGNLVLSVVPAGLGRDLLEFGQFLSATSSVKAELPFPVKDILPAAAPYDHVRFGSGTSCRGCHGLESAVNGFGGPAYTSSVVRPNLVYRQTSSRLRDVALQCNKAIDAERCEILNAIFVKGQAQDAELP